MPNPVTVQVGRLEFLKVNTGKREWRDTYHWVLSLSWPRFALLIGCVYLGINVLFAALYAVGGKCVEGMTAGSFPEAFFFSVQTLATVGYGHMYPQNLYGHILSTIEIIGGTFWFAVMTGLIFVRFSRPTARIEFSNSMVISNFDGKPALMLRIANLRHHSMVEAKFRIMLLRNEKIREGEEMRRFYTLKLDFDRIIAFPVALTLRHFIDEQSPLYRATAESLEAGDVRLVVSVVCVETVIPAQVQSHKDYSWRDIRFGERFVEIYNELGEGKLSVDYGRLHDTEPAPTG